VVARLQPLGGVPKEGALNEMQRSAPHSVGEGWPRERARLSRGDTGGRRACASSST
jgi:hypothetical protein